MRGNLRPPLSLDRHLCRGKKPKSFFPFHFQHHALHSLHNDPFLRLGRHLTTRILDCPQSRLHHENGPLPGRRIRPNRLLGRFYVPFRSAYLVTVSLLPECVFDAHQ